MTQTPEPHPLIGELLTDPEVFYDSGRSYDLLHVFFDGQSLESLTPLLAHPSLAVQRCAVFVAAELGEQGCSVIRHVAPLALSRDRVVAYHALESLLLCATGANRDLFEAIPVALESNDDVICRLAMSLMLRATEDQLRAALEVYGRTADVVSTDRVHQVGLKVLLRAEDENDAIGGDVLGQRYTALRRILHRNVRGGQLNADGITDACAARFIEDHVGGKIG